MIHPLETDTMCHFIYTMKNKPFFSTIPRLFSLYVHNILYNCDCAHTFHHSCALTITTCDSSILNMLISQQPGWMPIKCIIQWQRWITQPSSTHSTADHITFFIICWSQLPYICYHCMTFIPRLRQISSPYYWLSKEMWRGHMWAVQVLETV